MIAYEIQLRYVIRGKIQSESVQDKIRSETKFSPSQNLRIFSNKFFFSDKNFFPNKIFSQLLPLPGST